MPVRSATLWRGHRADGRRWHRWAAWTRPIRTPDRSALIPCSSKTRTRSSASTRRTRSRVSPRTRTRPGRAVDVSCGCLLRKSEPSTSGTDARAACPGDGPVANLAKNVWPSVPPSKPPGKFSLANFQRKREIFFFFYKAILYPNLRKRNRTSLLIIDNKLL